MPGEITRLVRIPVSVVITEMQYRILEEIGRAERETVDEEITDIVTMGLRAAVEICEGIPTERKHELFKILRDEW